MEAKVKEEVPDKDYQPSTTDRRKPPAAKEHRSPEQDESRSSPTPGPTSPQNNGTAALSSTESLSPPLGEARAPALIRLRRFLSALLQFASDVGADTAERVKHLIYNLASGTITIEEFQTGVQECTNYPLRASVPGFLRALLPAAQRDLHARARRAKQTPLQYVRAHEHLILESGGDGGDIFAQPGDSLKRRASDPRKMPNSWRLSIITPIHKGKGSVQDCGSYRGIKVMSHTMKLFERVIDSRLRQECTVSECQYGFRPGCGTIDPIFALRMLVEAYREKKTPLHMAFLDLQKAFDCVPRQVIWWALKEKNVPQNYIDIIRDMYHNSESIVRTAVGDTHPFPITVGVHQGSALSPFLFSVVLDVVSAKVHEPSPWLMMYADDIALTDEDKQKLEHKVNQWKGALEDGGLKLNVAKTEYMACGGTDPDPITVGGESVLKTDKFKYLGSVLHESGEIDHDVQARISAAWAKWREVTGVLCDPRIPVKLKGLVYKSIIRPDLLYGSETWPALGRHVQQLHVTEMKMLRWMCGVTRLDRIRNEHIRGSLGIRDVADKLQESRLRWFYEQTNGSEDFPPHAKRPPPSSLFLNPSPFLYPLPSNASLFDYGHYHGYQGAQEGGFERRDGGISVRDVSSMNASFPERLNPSLLKSDDEWKNINTMLNCILSMVEKTKRALAILQQRGVEPTESNDIKRAASEIMAQAVRQTEERVAEVRRRAEDAVNQVKRQALVELQRAVGAAEARALELVANERKDRRSPAPAPSPPQQNCCWNCGRKAQETCSGCNSARYCGAFCQHKDWESHHQVCAGRDQKPTALRTSPPATQPSLPNIPTLPTLPTLPSLPKPTRAPTPDNRLSLTSLNSAERLHTNQDRNLTSTSNDRIALATLSTAQGIISTIGKK
ncbi:protein CBFA2T1 [Leguminivora glycinivorella]|uniref:protein CBFA2T1 n=1 Tax=Leguminivora glycinivorella TaxID=1035111 RepID=UPI00200E2AFF|nr:protein CBFA2T1 [Leguminivora glycinivorella]